MKEIICLSIFIIYSILFALVMLIMGFIFQYRQPTKLKATTYECGITPYKETPKTFDIKFFNFAILFLIFDIETVFLYPIAIFPDNLTPCIFFEIFLFIGILLGSLFFVIGKKVLRFE